MWYDSFMFLVINLFWEKKDSCQKKIWWKSDPKQKSSINSNKPKWSTCWSTQQLQPKKKKFTNDDLRIYWRRNSNIYKKNSLGRLFVYMWYLKKKKIQPILEDWTFLSLCMRLWRKKTWPKFWFK